ncbi:ABC transporter permease [Vibrio albus]|uniref:ABC transporter permease n=1 Tax=Vibrio albus TaxID=2200953 RepID=A0A2U3B9A5_9VIBR|nr:ABC transporter permease [Vibrio albus]PWI33294.1 ABC transporter permease [Vibrio albus]
MLVKLAWRNIWRQKRRTFLTAGALALALFLSLLMRSMQEGSYSISIDHAARFYTGLIQLQHPKYAESLSINDLLPMTDDFIQPVLQNPDISDHLPRLESFALAAAGERSKGVMVIGAVPEMEKGYSNLDQKLIAGEFLTEDDRQVLIGERLANYFRLKIGDEIVLYGQGYRGQTAAGLYPVKGILHFPMPQLDSQLVYMPLSLAQNLYSTGKQVTAWVLHTRDLALVTGTEATLEKHYGDTVNVRDWEELAPEMSQQITMDKVSGIFMLYILYGVVGFGLFATITMMTLERQREFAVMLATGMLRIRLLQLVAVESLFIATLGIVLGLMVAAPVLTYLHFNPIQMTGDAARMMEETGFEPILPVLIAPSLIANQIIAVLVLLLISLIYPMVRIFRLSLASALKGGAHAH